MSSYQNPSATPEQSDTAADLIRDIFAANSAASNPMEAVNAIIDLCRAHPTYTAELMPTPTGVRADYILQGSPEWLALVRAAE